MGQQYFLCKYNFQKVRAKREQVYISKSLDLNIPSISKSRSSKSLRSKNPVAQYPLDLEIAEVVYKLRLWTSKLD